VGVLHWPKIIEDACSALTICELSLKIGILNTFKDFFKDFLNQMFLVLRNKVEWLKNSKKGEKTLFATMWPALVVILILRKSEEFSSFS
jgi:hypothetical protein